MEKVQAKGGDKAQGLTD